MEIENLINRERKEKKKKSKVVQFYLSLGIREKKKKTLGITVTE